MRYNNQILKVFMEWSPEVLYTEGDQVFNMIIDGVTYPQVKQCIKDLDTEGSTSTAFWKDHTTEAYENRIRIKDLYIGDTALPITDHALENLLNSDRLVSSEALSHILNRWRYYGFNANGELEYLDKGSDLDNISRSSRFKLYPNSTYKHIPEQFITESKDYISFCILDTSIVTGVLRFQSMFICRKDGSCINWVRWTDGGTYKYGNWTSLNMTQFSDNIKEFLNKTAIEYNNSLEELNQILTQLRDTSARLVYSQYLYLKDYKPINISAFEEGSYSLSILDGGYQITANFTSDDVDFVKYSQETMYLSTNSDDYTLSLYHDGGRVKLQIVTSSTNKLRIKVLRVPLISL